MNKMINSSKEKQSGFVRRRGADTQTRSLESSGDNLGESWEMAIRRGIYPPNIWGKGHTQGGSSNYRKEKPQNPRSLLGTWCSALATEKRAQDVISKGLFIEAQESVTICVAHSWETQTTWDVIICWNPINKAQRDCGRERIMST